MDQLYLMRVFVAVAEEQGFAAAARRLQLSAPAVTRAIARLEQELGVKLLNRTTRHVRSTDAGRGYLDDARRILAEVDQANEAVLGINSTPRGQLNITAPVLFGQKFVLPCITDYLDTYPQTSVNAQFLDRVVNLMEEGFDIGVRIGRLPDSSMQARRVGQVRFHWLASPRYLQQHGPPKTPADLKKHSTIASTSSSLTHDWQFYSKGQAQTLRLNSRLQVSTNQAAIDAARRDLGIIHVLSYQVADELTDGSLHRLLQDFEPEPMPVQIVFREGRHASSKVRCFIELLAEQLQNNPCLHS